MLWPSELPGLFLTWGARQARRGPATGVREHPFTKYRSSDVVQCRAGSREVRMGCDPTVSASPSPTRPVGPLRRQLETVVIGVVVILMTK